MLDAMWLKESEDRLAAYRAGELDAIDAKSVFADLRNKIWRQDSSCLHGKSLLRPDI